MTNNPLLSICIPTYNRADLLKETLESLQFVHQWPFLTEIVIADDCSSDHTQEVIRTAKSRFRSLRSVRHTKNQGALRNIMFLSSVSRGKYAVFLSDDGDRLIADRVAEIVHFMERNGNVVACYAAIERVTQNGSYTDPQLDSDYVYNAKTIIDLFSFTYMRGMVMEGSIFRTKKYISCFYNHAYQNYHDLFEFVGKGEVFFDRIPYYKHKMDDHNISHHYTSKLISSSYILLNDMRLTTSYVMNKINYDRRHHETVIFGENRLINRTTLYFIIGTLFLSKQFVATFELFRVVALWRLITRSDLPEYLVGLLDDRMNVIFATLQVIANQVRDIPGHGWLVFLDNVLDIDFLLYNSGQLFPDVTVLVLSETEVMASPERESFLIVTFMPDTKDRLVEAGVPYGRVIMMQKWLNFFKVS
ncbi:MAG: glycosyltransferase family 2 protein [Magnetococcales bacterium]|nr:glycosyltransferase family 2 protein [Magnetococcales bacterium]